VKEEVLAFLCKSGSGFSTHWKYLAISLINSPEQASVCTAMQVLLDLKHIKTLPAKLKCTFIDFTPLDPLLAFFFNGITCFPFNRLMYYT
jgi:hypothetical protein